MRKIISSLLVTLVAFSTTVNAAPLGSVVLASKTHYEIPKGDHTIYVTGVINGASFTTANKIERLSAASSDDINLFINSPGGMVAVGLQIIQAMDIARARGVKITCSVGILAASMAFQLLPHCDKRYAMKHSLLLFHPARAQIQGGVTAEEAAMIAQELRRVDYRANLENAAMMGSPSPRWLEVHHRNETLWEAQDLVAETKNNWLTLVDVLSVPGGAFNLENEGGANDRANPAVHNYLKFEFDGKPWIIVNI
jgi:hypothetical protein